MKTENIEKAHQTSEVLRNDLRKAFGDAIDSGNQFAEIVILDVLKKATELESKIKHIMIASQQNKTK